MEVMKNMYKRALILYNDQAGQNEAVKNLEIIINIFAPKIPEIILRRTEKKGDGERICREEGESVDLVCILGGDGTVHECINGLAELERPPHAAVLPGGTCNDFLRSLGVPQNMKQAVQAVFSGKVEAVDVVKVNERWFTNFLGIGLITETSENINDNLKEVFGKISYFISALQTMNTIEPFPFKLTADNHVIEDEGVMILVANGRFIGTSELPVSSISLQDGMLDVFILKQAGIPLVRSVLQTKGLSEWNPDPAEFEYIRTSGLSLETSAPAKIDMDGEIYMETPVRIELAKKLPFVTGENF